MQDFRDLKVWEKAHQLTLAVYRITKSFPRDEVFGLRSQVRRACLSIPSNIAEGCGRSGNAELRRFLVIAMGSASEVEYQLLLAHGLEYMDGPTYQQLHKAVCEVKRMLAAFIVRLDNPLPPTVAPTSAASVSD